MRRRAGEEVTASPVFESCVVGEEVLEQPWGCLAYRYTEPWLVEVVTMHAGTVPGGMAATGVVEQ